MSQFDVGWTGSTRSRSIAFGRVYSVRGQRAGEPRADRRIKKGDVPLYGDGVARALAGTQEICVVGTAGCAEHALQLVRYVEPDIVLLDMAMPGAFAVARDIAQTSDHTRVIALAIQEEDRAVVACAEVGVAGYLPRDCSVCDAIEVIVAVARGEARCSPRIVGYLLRRIAALAAERESNRHGHGGTSPELTAREVEILALLRQGLSNKMIARRLGIELATVKNHVHSVFGKLGLRCRAEAVLLHPDATEATDDSHSLELPRVRAN